MLEHVSLSLLGVCMESVCLGISVFWQRIFCRFFLCRFAYVDGFSGHGHALLMDLSFNMFDIILARLLKIFEVAPDLDSAVYLEDTAMLSPVVKIFVEWIQSSYQKWFPLSASQLSAPRE